MKKKLKAISSELKKASKTHAGQAAKIDKLMKPKLNRKKAPPKSKPKPVISQRDSMRIKSAKRFRKGTEKYRKSIAGNDSGKVQDVFEQQSSLLRGLKKKYGNEAVQNVKPKLSKLHKKKRRLKRPKLARMIGEQPRQELKPKKSLLGKVAGLAALGGVAFGLSKLLKKKSKK